MAATRGCLKQKHPPSLGNVYMLQPHTLLPKLTNLPTPPSSVACLFDLPWLSVDLKAAHISFASRSTISSRRLQACQGLQRLARACKSLGLQACGLSGADGCPIQGPASGAYSTLAKHHNVKINDLLHKLFTNNSRLAALSLPQKLAVEARHPKQP